MATVEISVGDKTFKCPAAWSVEKVEKKIREKLGLVHGGLEHDGVAMDDNELLDTGGSYAFVDGVSSSGKFCGGASFIYLYYYKTFNSDLTVGILIFSLSVVATFIHSNL